MEATAAEMQALELKAKMQVRVYRTLMRHKLIMTGNALLVGYLFAVLLVALWTAALMLFGDSYMPWSADLVKVPPERLMWLSAMGMAGFKLGAALFLLCPGLGLRICGGLMKA